MKQINHLSEKLMIYKIEKYLVRWDISIDYFHKFLLFLAEEEHPDSVKQMNKEELTPNIPNFAQYLIIGGGAAAMSAFKSIRAHDATAKVCFILLINSFLLYLISLGSCY